jgi:hypothetical protein
VVASLAAAIPAAYPAPYDDALELATSDTEPGIAANVSFCR